MDSAAVSVPAPPVAPLPTPAIQQTAEIETVTVPVPQPAAKPQYDPAALPVYATVTGDGLNLGVLQMQLHVHSTSVTNRFVVINGSRRREGEQLSEGPVVEQIVPEGAVLSYQGRVFLLTPN